MIFDDYKLKRLKGSLKGKRVFLLGNGPSVRYKDLEALKGEVCFAANRFHLCYDKTSFRPSLTFLEDKKMIQDHYDEIIQSCESPLLVPSRFLYRKSVFKNLIRYNFLTQKDEESVSLFSSDIEEGMYSGSSVMFGMLQAAASMEAAEVILYGVDHTFQIPQSDHPLDSNLVKDSGEENHFISGYRNKGASWYKPETIKINQGFELAKKTLEARAVKVYNATRGGQLDIFQRRSFDCFFPSQFSGLRTMKELKVCLRLPKKTNENEKALISFFEKMNFQLTVKTNQESGNYERFDLVLSSGNHCLSIPDHPSSYYFISSSLKALSHMSSSSLPKLRSRDFIRGFDYYHGVLTASSLERQKLMEFGVKVPVYSLGA